MARIGPESSFLVILLCLILIEINLADGTKISFNQTHVSHEKEKGYQHKWPEIQFGWKIIIGAIIAFFGAACGSVGGVGGGGIFVPMLALIIGFDPKSSTAMSKCMITGAAASTVYYNINLRHPTLDLPIIDYDLALLFQPVLVLGISIGVTLNTFRNFPEKDLSNFAVMSTKAFFKGIETWKKETIQKKVKKISNEPTRSNGTDDKKPEEFVCEPEEIKEPKRIKVPLIENVKWKDLGLLVGNWIVILALQIAKNYTSTCSILYWLLNVLQIPVAFSVSGYEAYCLYKGKRRIESKGEGLQHWPIYKLIFCCLTGVFAGVVGGLLGLGGGFILSPFFLEMGIPPQVASATSTFAMTFSASMSVIEYYLLKRFPVPYSLYFVAVTTIAALVGQHVVRKLIDILGRASIIIFILALTIFASAIFLGGVGLDNMARRIEHKKYMGFDILCY
ncbi:hypothetical protein ACFE04_003964 [Oxalis oulophora]